MRITLVRHGETEQNALGIIQGHLEGRLSAEGLNQSKRVAEELKGQKFDVVFSSDLKRCVETASPIMALHPETKLVLTDSLRERDFGEFQGVKKSEVQWDILPGSILDKKPPNGESGKEMRLRIINFINDLVASKEYQDVLLVTHSGPICAVKACVEGIDQTESINLKIANCSVHTYSISSPLELNI